MKFAKSKLFWNIRKGKTNKWKVRKCLKNQNLKNPKCFLYGINPLPGKTPEEREETDYFTSPGPRNWKRKRKKEEENTGRAVGKNLNLEDNLLLLPGKGMSTQPLFLSPSLFSATPASVSLALFLSPNALA
jgi:hypothetical protein